jgi:hypothetical protein
MDFKALERLISDTANHKGIDKHAITQDLADFLKVKYSVSIMEKERDLIDEVKNKVITKLYNSDRNSVASNKDLQKSFKLDLLEIDYLSTAIDELTQAGIVKFSKAEYLLTKEGVMKFKEFYGEI